MRIDASSDIEYIIDWGFIETYITKSEQFKGTL